MDINKAFKIIKHSWPDSCLNSIGHVIIKQGALQEMCALAEKYSKIVFVTDTETYNVCGVKIINMLGGKLEKFLLYENGNAFKSDEHSLEKLRFMISGETELIIGAGGETVQDICKCGGYEANIPHYMVALRPSSVKCIFPEAALIKNHVRRIYPAHTPKAIIADTNIMKLSDENKLRQDYETMYNLFFEINEKLRENSNRVNNPEELIKIFYGAKETAEDIKNGLQKQSPKAVEKLTEALLVLEAVNYDLNKIK